MLKIQTYYILHVNFSMKIPYNNKNFIKKKNKNLKYQQELTLVKIEFLQRILCHGSPETAT